MSHTWIPVKGEVAVLTSAVHRFGTDAMLLSHFAAPAKGERVCELGTGCGAIALRFCAGWQPEAVHGVDIAPCCATAFAVAQAKSPTQAQTNRCALTIGL